MIILLEALGHVRERSRYNHHLVSACVRVRFLVEPSKMHSSSIDTIF